jgi:hypothetical protein
MKKETSKIFSGEYSRDMWEAINSAKSKADLQTAIYVVCCRLQEFESRLTKRVPDRLRLLLAVSIFINVVLLAVVLAIIGGR